MSSAQPFSVHTPEERLLDLRQRLALTRFSDELEGADWDYGVPLTDIRRLVDYWQNGFDWRKQEAVINALSQFTVDIPVDDFGTLNIHYVHQPSLVRTAIPLLFVHGCSSPISPTTVHLFITFEYRAWKLSRSDKVAPAVDLHISRSPQLPRRRAESSRIWILGSTQEEGV